MTLRGVILVVLLCGNCHLDVAIATTEKPVIASVYTDLRVATGAKFDGKLMAAAHKTLPFGTRVTLRHGRRSAVVLINDRGPFVKGRVFDLTPASAKALACSGLCRVRVESWPPFPKPRPTYGLPDVQSTQEVSTHTLQSDYADAAKR